MRFKTVSGSEYEIQDGEIRRLNALAGKRADGEWLTLIQEPVIEIGESAIIRTESLRTYGPDDYGTPDGEADPFSTRITSEVTEIYND